MQELAWLWHFWRACNSRTYTKHRSALQQLAFFSRTQLHGIIERHGFELDRARGYLVALRSAKELDQVQSNLTLLRELGVPFSQLDEAAAREIEPAINPDTHFAGAIHLPDDEVANCRQFALLLKDESRRLGVSFEFHSSVQNIQLSVINSVPSATVSVAAIVTDSQLSGFSRSLTTLDTKLQSHSFDSVVLCTGAHSSPLLHSAGIRLPLASVYGYSVSAHVKEPLNAPRSGLMDERYKVSITRLGQRVRVAGSAQVGGSAGSMHRAALQTLYKVLQDWFPGAAVMSQGVQEWQGARPMLANRPPVVGAGPQPGLWLNLGHGSSGWALACGSARLLADALGGNASAVDAQAFKLI